MRQLQINTLFLLGYVFLWGFPLQASELEMELLFEQANKAYNGSDYEGAITLYDSILNQGYESADIYYNLGNAHFRLGNVGQSILSYERSLELDPEQPDAAFNLRLANLRVVDNIEPMPEFLIVTYAKDFLHSRSSGSWGLWSIGFLWAALGFGAVFLFMSSYSAKRLGFFVGLLCLLISFGSLSLSLIKRNHEINNRYAIVLNQNAYVKASPFGQAKDLVILHEGVKVRLLRTSEEWTEIRISDSNVGEIVGWVESGVLEQI